jgi:hypothetical protein
VASTWHHFGKKFNWSKPKNEVKKRVHGLENEDIFKVQGYFFNCLFFFFFFLILIFFYILQEWTTFCELKTLLTHTPITPFFNTSNVDMVGFVDLQKVVD